MRRGLLLAIGWMILATTGAVGQNLVVNGDFDGGLGGWMIGGQGGGSGDPSAVSHRPDIDALGDAMSGSAEIDLTSEPTLLSQCILIPPPLTSLTDGLATRSESQWSLDLEFFTDENCQVPVPFDANLGGIGPSNIFSFSLNQIPLPTIPPTTQSVRLSAYRDESIPQTPMLFDKIFLVKGLPEEFPPHTASIELLGSSGLQVHLSGTASGGISPFARRYLWSFGDGNVSEGQEVTHTFVAPGTYLVTLVAESGYDDPAFDQLEVTVTGLATEIPTVSSIGLAVLAAILGLGGMILLRRRGFFPGS